MTAFRRAVSMTLLALLAACGGNEAPGDDAGVPPSGSPETVSPASAPDVAPPADAVPDPRTEAPATDAESGLEGGWQWEPVTGGGAPGSVVLQAVRTARHDGYDRVVLEFEGGVPEYTVRYAGRPLHQCGSGHVIEVDAAAILQVELRGADAHTQQGEPTVADRDRSPGLPVLRHARLTCDFEAVVEWVLGVDQRVPYRVFTLEGPPRLVVDLRHP